MSDILPVDAAFRDAIRSKAEGKGKDVDSLALSLIAAGANINIPSTNSRGNPVTALNVFTNDGVAATLRSKGARSLRDARALRAAIYARDTNEALRIIRTQWPLVSFRGTSGRSVLSLAISQGLSDLVIPLLDAGAEMETNIAGAEIKNGDINSLCLAVINNMPDYIINYMIANGASIYNAFKSAITYHPGIGYVRRIVNAGGPNSDEIINRATILYTIGVEESDGQIKNTARELGAILPPPIPNPNPNQGTIYEPDRVIGGSRKRRSTRRRKPRKSKRAYTR